MTSQEIEEKSYGKVKSVAELGQLMRRYRKEQHVSLEQVAGLSNLSMRFLSELERGKETAEIGKALKVLNNLGLDVWILPRGQKPS